MILTYKYRMYPNKTQEKALERALSIGWRIWNDAAHQRDTLFKQGEKLGKFDQAKLWRDYRNQHAELQILPSHTVEKLIERLDNAYKAFFALRRNGHETARPPGEKKRRDFNTLDYRYLLKKQAEGQPVEVKGSGCKFTPERPGLARLYLMSIGSIRVHQHRPLPDGWLIKSIQIKQDKNDWWHCYLQIQDVNVSEETQSRRPHLPDYAVGLDMGLVSLITSNDGHYYIPHPHWYLNLQDKRTRLGQKTDRQRRAANPDNYHPNGTVKDGVFIWRKSNRQRKTQLEVRRVEARATRQREHFWQVITNDLTRNYRLIVIEDLQLKFMQQNGRLAKHVYDAGLARFRNLLLEKAERRGVIVEIVNPAYTSQTCAECGHVAPENRPDQATFRCVACGHTDHADVNAARNILALGLAQHEAKQQS